MVRRRTGPLSLVVAALALLAAATLALPLGGGVTPYSPPSATLGAPTQVASGPVLVAGGYLPGPGVQDLGVLPGTTPLTVLVGLPSQDPGGFQAYEDAAYIPGTGAYHQFLTPSALAQRYGASPGTRASVAGYFEEEGLHTSISPDGLLMTVAGSAASLASAFGTTFHEYRDGSGRVFFSHPSAAHLPAGVPVSGVYGLGNATSIRPLDLLPGVAATLAAPQISCSSSSGLIPCDIWNGYDESGLLQNGTDGAGERIGVVDAYDSEEPQTELASDLSSFDSQFDLAPPSVSFNYPVPTTTNLNATGSSGWGTEEALDMEWSHATAPGASIAFTFAPNSGVGLYLAVDWLVSHQRVDVISLSWGEPDVGIFNAFSGGCTSECNASSDGSYEILSPVLQAAALEGISVFVATGDCGASDGTSGLSTDYPASDPSATAVGGTYLSVNSNGTYESESGWSGNSTGAHSPGCQNQGGSGGGYSPFPRPYWQTGPGVSTSPGTRAIPDVSADASDGVEIIAGGGEGFVGGTSLATPMWAGFAAVSDQYVGHDLGLLGPSFYQILNGPDYGRDFHDITSGNNGYAAGTGWDAVTGIGTPILGALVTDLSGSAGTVSSLSALLYANVTAGAAPLHTRLAIAASGGHPPYLLQGVYFGDGTSALTADGVVLHTFSKAGVYAVIAFVADSTGNVTTSAPEAIVVGGGGSLNVTLTPSTGAPAVGTAVTFTTTVVGGSAPYSYLYVFGDGTFLNLSTTSRTTHAYANAGSFCASVIVQDASQPVNGARGGPIALTVGDGAARACSNATQPFSVIAEPPAPIRDAPADFPSLFQVQGGVTDGGSRGVTEGYTSSDPYVAACGCTIFRAAGTFRVSLNATDLVGDRASNETNVTVAPVLTASFTAAPTFGTAPLTVLFHASTAGGYLAQSSDTRWNFGDGVDATGASVSHTYSTPGFYSATGDAWDQGQGNASEGFVIDVLPGGSSGPALSATFAPAVNVSSGTTIHFTAHTTGANGSSVAPPILWNLGENSTAWGPVASLTYYGGAAGLSPNLYASVTAEWGGGVPSAEATLVTPQLFASESGDFTPSLDALQLSASGGPISGSPGLNWSGAAVVAAPGGGTAEWTFGDGTSANGVIAAHPYAHPGSYSAVVNATDPWGDGATVEFGVQIGVGLSPILVVQGGPSIEGGAAPLLVSFFANASGGAIPYSFAWHTGDGATNANQTFQHEYTAPGNYSVTLTVHDGSGASVALNWSILVVAAPSSHVSGTSSDVPIYVVIGAVVVALAVLSVALWDRRRARPPSP